MKDTVIKGDGTSRNLKAPANMPETFEEWRTQLLEGVATMDINLNTDGCDVVGTPLSKNKMLSDATKTALNLTQDDPSVNDALYSLAGKAPENHASENVLYGVADGNLYGHVKLSSAVPLDPEGIDMGDPTTEGVAASWLAFAKAYKLGWQALPKSGGAMTGELDVGKNKIKFQNGAIFTGTNTQTMFIQPDLDNPTYGINVGVVENTWTIAPNGATEVNLGSPTYRFNQIYSRNQLNVSSDKRLKKSIKPVSENDPWINALHSMIPCEYQWKEDESGKVHIGLIAQQVEKALTDAGLDPSHCALLNKHKDEQGEELYSLCYDELIPLLIVEIQELRHKVMALESNKTQQTRVDLSVTDQEE